MTEQGRGSAGVGRIGLRHGGGQGRTESMRADRAAKAYLADMAVERQGTRGIAIQQFRNKLLK